MKYIFGVIACAFLISCTSLNSIYRETNLNESGKSVVLDAQQRVVTNTAALPWDGDKPPRYVKPSRIICPEPSPDVASSLSRAITASLESIQADGSKTSAEAGYASAQSLAQLGQRLATTQLLRDELADLCRSYANGAISTTNYTLRLAQLDEKMVTLLTAEMIAGAFQRDSAMISGDAFVSDSPASKLSPSEESELSNNITSKKNELATAEQTLAGHVAAGAPLPQKITPEMNAEQIDVARRNDEISLANYNNKMKLLQANRSSAEQAVRRAQIAYNEARSGGGAIGHLDVSANLRGGDISSYASTNSRASELLVKLQQNYLDRDELGAIVDTCLTRMNEDVIYTPPAELDSEATENDQLEKLLADRAMLESQLESFRAELTNNEAKLELESKEKRMSESAKLRNTIKVKQEFNALIAPIVAKIKGIEERIRFKREKTTGISSLTTDFNEVCETLMKDFSKQLMRAQNARLELKLKEMEAEVQIEALETRQKIASFEYCSTIAQNAPELIKDNREAFSLCSSGLNFPSGRLGSLQSLNHGSISDLESGEFDESGVLALPDDEWAIGSSK